MRLINEKDESYDSDKILLFAYLIDNFKHNESYYVVKYELICKNTNKTTYLDYSDIMGNRVGLFFLIDFIKKYYL